VELILALESSSDETAVALVAADGRVVRQDLASQVRIHELYGGVVPEVASRAHFEEIDRLVRPCLNELKTSGHPLKAVAATRGPGLIGPLLVGSCYAEGLAQGFGVPFVGVHHLRGHLASVLLGSGSSSSLKEQAAEVFPALVVLVSGGHTQVLEVDSALHARIWADTADDAAGECFDKAAKLMGLPYPGGPRIEALAAQLSPSDAARAREVSKSLPRPRSAEGFSFSGLKTAIRLSLERDPTLSGTPAFAWAVQEAIAETLLAGIERVRKQRGAQLRRLAFCGGVSANRRLRFLLEEWAKRHSLKLSLPPLQFCTDNAAMIGAAAWVQDPSLALAECAARIPLGASDV